MSYSRWGYLGRTLLLTAAFVSSTCVAQIRIGQTAGFTGTVAASVKETTDGALLYIDWVNANGGVHGQKIELVSLDDKFEPALAAKNARELIVDRGVVALFLSRGTPHAEAIIPILNDFKVPLIAPSTGAMSIRTPVQPYVFNVRSSYQREAERAIRHLLSIGVERIAVLQVDDSFGDDAVAGVNAGFAGSSTTPVLHAKFDRAKPVFGEAARKIAEKNAQAVVFLGSGSAVANGTSAIRKAGSKAQIVTLSNNAASGFIKLMGENASGTIVTQVFPNERSLSLPVVNEAYQLAKAKGLASISPATMEGFAGAKVLVEALRRAGPKPTSQAIIAGLHGIRKYDIGGLEVSFSPTDHSGVTFADLSIITSAGQFRR